MQLCPVTILFDLVQPSWTGRWPRPVCGVTRLDETRISFSRSPV
jgi:hypothetical protein